jgi:hypothetical protein
MFGRQPQIKVCPGSGCRRPFQVNRFGTHLSGMLEAGKITCPHCGTMLTAERSSVFMTHALSTEQEAWFKHRNSIAA